MASVVSSLLARAKTGAPPSALRVTLYGTPGIGKTTFAAKIPGAFFLSCEDGGGDMEYTRIDIHRWADLVDALAEIERDGLPPEFRALVIDTINGMSEKCAEAICESKRVDSLEEVGGGFGKGYTLMQEWSNQVRDTLDRIRQKHGLHIVLLGHAQVKTFNDPNGPSYDRYSLRMNDKIAAVWTAWSDIVAFATLNVIVKGGQRATVVEDPTKKGKAVSGTRCMYLTSDAAYEAKNRHNMPDELPLSWDAFAKAINWEKREAGLRKVVTAEDIAAILSGRVDCTPEEATILTTRLLAACQGDLTRAHRAAAGGVSASALEAKVAELRSGGK